MKKIYSGVFNDAEKLAKYINDNNIQKEDIVSITQSYGEYTLFFYF